ncbi:MAG: hypothetical protein QOG97_1449, partial [Acidimicrobiaceae bacterium]|nr:hypothetical protein [Acidimicrobiaceae bacterium]
MGHGEADLGRPGAVGRARLAQHRAGLAEQAHLQRRTTGKAGRP